MAATATLPTNKSSPKVQLVPQLSRSANVGNTSSTAISSLILTTTAGEGIAFTGFSLLLRQVGNYDKARALVGKRVEAEPRSSDFQ